MFCRRSFSKPSPDATKALSFAIHIGGGLFRRNLSLKVEEFQFLFKCFHCLKILSYSATSSSNLKHLDCSAASWLRTEWSSLYNSVFRISVSFNSSFSCRVYIFSLLSHASSSTFSDLRNLSTRSLFPSTYGFIYNTQRSNNTEMNFMWLLWYSHSWKRENSARRYISSMWYAPFISKCNKHADPQGREGCD